MNRITGTYQKSSALGEIVRAFVPHPLPPSDPPLVPTHYAEQLSRAEFALARLQGVTGLVPSVEWLLYSAVRKEALLTSQIEGTQASLNDLFDEEAGIKVSNAADVEEVTNYLKAFRFVQHQLRDPKGLPISARLLRDAHQILMTGVRGASKQPGEIRRSQNWIGGTRPGNAVFVPPPPEKVNSLLAQLERFIHAREPKSTGDAQAPLKIPTLVKIALVHAQFETIHPFLDGNGRIGRLLIAAMLESTRLLSEPLLYLSGYLKQHQQEYYKRLSAIRTDGDWEGWVAYFLEAVSESAQIAERNIVAIASLIASDRRRILAVEQLSPASYRLFEALPMMPRFTVEQARKLLASSFPTANAAVKLLERIGIVSEVTGQKKHRTYSYKGYIDLLAS